MHIWRLNKGHDRRLRSGHPWVFSNEITGSPKGISNGLPIEVQDLKGQFIARGYGNPNSLISFRALSFDPQDTQPTSLESLVKKLCRSWAARVNIGLHHSFRLCFAESDYLPGLIVDLYRSENTQGPFQVFCFQIVTAGIQAAVPTPLELFEKLVAESLAQNLSTISWQRTAVVQRNDVNIRKLEGLDVPEPVALKELEGVDLRNCPIHITGVEQEPLVMNCDLVEGQKTGFFLDQSYNIRLLCNMIRNRPWKQKQVKVLDLCCYVGQWGSQIAKCLKDAGYEPQVTLVDVSQTALDFAKQNVERTGARVEVLKTDVLDGIAHLESDSFDIVIADPPAFIKARKDIPVGKHAYLKLNTQAFRIVKKGGFVASCSCSGLLTEEDFKEVLIKASARSRKEARVVLHGGHAADHPTIFQFPEGFYLKMFVSLIS